MRLGTHLTVLANGPLRKSTLIVRHATLDFLGGRTLRRCGGVHGTRGGNSGIGKLSTSTLGCLCLVTVSNRRVPLTRGRATCGCFLSGIARALAAHSVASGTLTTVILRGTKRGGRTLRFVTSLGRFLAGASRRNVFFTFGRGPCS